MQNLLRELQLGKKEAPFVGTVWSYVLRRLPLSNHAARVSDLSQCAQKEPGSLGLDTVRANRYDRRSQSRS